MFFEEPFCYKVVSTLGQTVKGKKTKVKHTKRWSRNLLWRVATTVAKTKETTKVDTKQCNSEIELNVFLESGPSIGVGN